MPEDIDFDPLDRLESLLDRIQEAKDRHRLGDALVAAVRAVNVAEPAVARLEHLAGFAPLVADFLEPSDSDQCRRLLGAVRDVGQFLSQAADHATLQDAVIKLSQLQGQITQADGVFLRGWKTKVDQTFFPTGRLGSVLREIPETQQLGLEMETLFHAAETLAQSIDDPKRCADQFSELTSRREIAKGNLARLGAGEAVVNFLSAVAERTASLTNVTAEVRDWLGARNALERFRVVL